MKRNKETLIIASVILGSFLLWGYVMYLLVRPTKVDPKGVIGVFELNESTLTFGDDGVVIGKGNCNDLHMGGHFFVDKPQDGDYEFDFPQFVESHSLHGKEGQTFKGEYGVLGVNEYHKCVIIEWKEINGVPFPEEKKRPYNDWSLCFSRFENRYYLTDTEDVCYFKTTKGKKIVATQDESTR